MKQLKILLCIFIIIICIQVTYSRYNSQLPSGEISAKTGEAIIDLEYVSVESNDYIDSLPSLLDSTCSINYNFNVKNYKSGESNSLDISDVDLKAFIYVVFYDKSGNPLSNLDCLLSSDDNTSASKQVLGTETSITVNGSSVKLPKGTIKFSPSEILKKGTQSTITYHLKITPNIDFLPMSEVLANMKIYCLGEQPV